MRKLDLSPEERRKHDNELRNRWRLSNPEKWKESQQKWVAANPWSAKLRNARYLAKNLAKVREQQREDRRANPDKHRDRVARCRHKRLGIPEPTRPCPDRCECCGGPSVGNGKRHKHHIDHDHNTGAFRGWLCHKCNCGIGLLGDNEEGLERALRYLRKSRN